MANQRLASTDALLKIYNAIREAKKSDEDNSEKQSVFYGVKEWADFREQTDEIEKILSERGVQFEKIQWD